MLGLGRDKISGVYKLVWLYGSKSKTICEVFSFKTNIWRNVTPSPYRIVYGENPTCVHGSLHWLSEVYDSKRHIVSFDLYTETFEVNLKTPSDTVDHVAIGDLNHRLCISEKKDKKQEIWLLNPDKQWEKTYSIDLEVTSFLFFATLRPRPIRTIATFKKNKILLHIWKMYGRELVMYDPELDFYGLPFSTKHRGVFIAYFPSLVTV